MKSVDQLVKSKKMPELTAPSEYQTVRFDTDQMDELEGMKIGDKLVLVTEAEITGMVREGNKTCYTLSLKRGDVADTKEKKKPIDEVFEPERPGKEDISRPKFLQTKAHRFNQQTVE